MTTGYARSIARFEAESCSNILAEDVTRKDRFRRKRSENCRLLRVAGEVVS